MATKSLTRHEVLVAESGGASGEIAQKCRDAALYSQKMWGSLHKLCGRSKDLVEERKGERKKIQQTLEL